MTDNGLDEFSNRVGNDLASNRPTRAALTRRDITNVGLDDDCDDEEGNNFMKPSSTSSERRWSNSDSSFWPCTSTYDNLPPGLYKPRSNSNIGTYLEKQIVDTDELMILPDTASSNVLEEIRKFWKLKDEFDHRGFIHKRGILMWGDPGSGKTSTIQIMIQDVIKDGGIAIFASIPHITVEALQMIRRIEPNRKIICILEDFESLIREYGDQEFLAMLDGESQVSEVVFVATTNYPEQLDKRFVDRPSRFDTIVKVGMPNAEARREYLSNKEPTLQGDELEEWVEKSDGFAIAHLKEMIIANRCYGKSIDEIIERLNKMRDRDISSKDAIEGQSVKLGFQT